MRPLYALSIIWTIGLVFIVYLLFFSETDATVKAVYANNYLIKNDIGNKNINGTQNDNPEVKDAYVFINVNKKHFLTRFVSIVPDEHSKNDPLEKGAESVRNLSVEKINKIVKSRSAKKPDNFAIKPAPEL
jgi:hypothetical protein